MSQPSSEVHGPRFARLGDRGGIGSRHMYWTSVTGFGWAGGSAWTCIGKSDGAGSTRTGSVISAHGSRLAGGWPSDPDGVVFTIRLNTVLPTRSRRRASSEARSAARAGVIASSEWPCRQKLKARPGTVCRQSSVSSSRGTDGGETSTWRTEWRTTSTHQGRKRE